MQIYADDETKAILKEIKQKDKDFNASLLFKQAIKKRYYYSENIDLDEIRRQMKEIEHKKSTLDEEMKYLQELEKRTMINQELDKKRLEQEQEEKNKILARKEEIKNNCKQTFFEETGEEMTEELYKIYDDLGKANILTFSDKYLSFKNSGLKDFNKYLKDKILL